MLASEPPDPIDINQINEADTTSLQAGGGEYTLNCIAGRERAL